MARNTRSLSLVAALVSALAIPAFAQAMPDVSVDAALGSMGARAAVVFAGQVTSIHRDHDVVEVQFRVDEKVKGELSGVYILREWAGRWQMGQARYRVGQFGVFFLHGQTARGMGSSVDGMEGVLPMTIAPGEEVATVGVERLRARVLRRVGAPMVAAGKPRTVAAVRDVVVATGRISSRPGPEREDPDPSRRSRDPSGDDGGPPVSRLPVTEIAAPIGGGNELVRR
jgi:hypothetical protein